MRSLGLVMLTHNEEEFLGDSLESIVPWVDQAIVIDQYSTDKTVMVAESIGAKVMLAGGNFLTIGEKYFRDLAASFCQTDWMMITDADEVMSDGWADHVRDLIDNEGDNYGAIELPFYHLIGSYEFHSLDSPLWRAAFVRRHPRLTGCAPMRGPVAHSNYHLSYEPPTVKRFDGAEIFHLGYVQRNLMKRWRTNIARGDYGYSIEQADLELARLETNPCFGLPECQPMSIPIAKYPSILQGRVGRSYSVEYDYQARRILARSPISA